MKKLIEALTLLNKYEDPSWPTHCQRDALHVLVDPSKFTSEELALLDTLGFFASNELGQPHFTSYRYGSA